MCGVDHIVYKGKPYVLEINGSPGSGADYEGYQYKDYYSDPEPSGRIDGETMMSYVIDWVKDRTHWDRQSLIECGWLETMEVDECGYLPNMSFYNFMRQDTSTKTEFPDHSSIIQGS